MSEAGASIGVKRTGGTAEGSVVREAAALIASFLKALKGYRLYLPNSKILQGFVHSFHEKLTAFLERHGEITYRVTQFQIHHAGESVYENRSKEASLAFRLFVHGVRELTFHEEVPLAEVQGLLQVLHRAFDSQTTVDDLLTLLWEKDLQYISFIILDDFFEDGEQAEFEDFVKEGRRNDPSASWSRKTTEPLIDRLLSRTPTDVMEDPGDEFLDIFQLTEEEIAQVAAWMEAERSRDLIHDLCALVMEILEAASREDESGDLLVILDRVLNALLDEGHMLAAARIIHELRDFDTRQQESPVRRVVRQVLDKLGGARVVEAVTPHLPTMPDEERAAIVAFLASLDASAVPPLLSLLEQPALRDIVSEVLGRMAGEHLPLILVGLRSPRPKIVTAVLRLVGELGDSRSIGSLQGLLGHSDPGIRREAVTALGKIQSPAALPLLEKVLEDPAPEARIQALRAISALPPHAARGTLLRIARGKEFARRSYFEKKEILHALGRVKDRETEELLVSVLRKRPWFRKEEYAELRACALAALARIGTPTAVAEIQARADDRSPVVRRAVAQALRSIQRAKSRPEPEA